MNESSIHAFADPIMNDVEDYIREIEEEDGQRGNRHISDWERVLCRQEGAISTAISE